MYIFIYCIYLLYIYIFIVYIYVYIYCIYQNVNFWVCYKPWSSRLHGLQNQLIIVFAQSKDQVLFEKGCSLGNNSTCQIAARKRDLNSSLLAMRNGNNFRRQKWGVKLGHTVSWGGQHNCSVLLQSLGKEDWCTWDTDHHCLWRVGEDLLVWKSRLFVCLFVFKVRDKREPKIKKKKDPLLSRVATVKWKDLWTKNHVWKKRQSLSCLLVTWLVSTNSVPHESEGLSQLSPTWLKDTAVFQTLPGSF